MNRRSEIQRFIIGKRVLSLLASLLAIFVVLYVYFVSSSIVNVLVREEVDFDIAVISSEISELEARYLEEKNKMTLEYAYTLGFNDLKKKDFVIRASLATHDLTFNGQ
jgi:hypothetical protein